MTALQLAFLGFSEHFRQFREGNSHILRWNILGLTNIVAIPFLPLTSIPWDFIFAGRSVGAVTDDLLDIPLRIVSDDNDEIGFITIRVTAPGPRIDTIPSSTTEFFGWKIFTADGTPFLFTKPGRYFIKIQNADSHEEPIGEFSFVVADPPPLTPETIAAIRSDPHAAKTVRLSLGCKLCSKKIALH